MGQGLTRQWFGILKAPAKKRPPLLKSAHCGVIFQVNMNKIIKTFNLIVILALFISLFSPVAIADNLEVAKLPYDSLLKLHDTMTKTLSKNIPLYLKIFSYDPEVRISDITLQLVSNKDSIEIPIDPCGYINLPIRRDLVGHGAYFVSNQPKGSMGLHGEFGSQVPLHNKTISYKELISPVVAAESASVLFRDVLEVTEESHLESLHLIIDQESVGPVIIRLEPQNSIELYPDGYGNVLIPIEDNLFQKNPVVEFPSDKVLMTKPWQ
jgi:hypothetical protein